MSHLLFTAKKIRHSIKQRLSLTDGNATTDGNQTDGNAKDGNQTDGDADNNNNNDNDPDACEGQSPKLFRTDEESLKGWIYMKTFTSSNKKKEKKEEDRE